MESTIMPPRSTGMTLDAILNKAEDVPLLPTFSPMLAGIPRTLEPTKKREFEQIQQAQPGIEVAQSEEERKKIKFSPKEHNFSCELCNNKYTTKAGLKKHLTSKHPGSGRELQYLEESKERLRKCFGTLLYRNIGYYNKGTIEFEQTLKNEKLFDLIFVTTKNCTIRREEVEWHHVYNDLADIQSIFSESNTKKTYSLRFGAELYKATITPPLHVYYNPLSKKIQIQGQYSVEKELRLRKPKKSTGENLTFHYPKEWKVEDETATVLQQNTLPSEQGSEPPTQLNTRLGGKSTIC